MNSVSQSGESATESSLATEQQLSSATDQQPSQTDQQPSQTDQQPSQADQQQPSLTELLNIRGVQNFTDIPPNIPLSNILLPDEWVLYLYDKTAFKRLATNEEGRNKPPYSVVCTLVSLNDLIYLIQFMNVRVPPGMFNKGSDSMRGGRGGSVPGPNRRSALNQINLDMNDYILMRKGVAPMWEDPRNKNGGIFSVKLNHKKGFELWKTMVLRMIGETLMGDMQYITGMSMSYIPVSHNSDSDINADNSETFLKIWDGKKDRNQSQFLAALPSDITCFFKREESRYTFHHEKTDFDKNNIVSRVSAKSDSKKGAFRTPGRGGRGRGRF